MKIEPYETLEELEKENKLLKEEIEATKTVKTWTPKITTLEGKEPAITYTIQKGLYVKIGRLVYVEFYIRGKITALNGVDNYARIAGLPFRTHDSLSQGQEALSKAVVYNLVNTNNIVFDFHNDMIRLQATDGSSAAKLIVTSGSYFEIGGSGWYITR